MSSVEQKALFLDRDGVVVKALDPAVRNGYLVHPDEVEILPGIAELVKAAQDRGYKVVVVTNQPQIGKGIISEDDLARIHGKVAERVAGIDRIYYCPHTNQDGCACRKPSPGMLHRAAEELGIDLKSSVMIGDSDRDIAAGKAAGCRTVFVRNELKGHELANCEPDLVVEILSEAIRFLD